MPDRTPWDPTTGDVITATRLDGLPRGWLSYAEVSANQSGIAADTALTGLTSGALVLPAGRRIEVVGQTIVSATIASTIAVGWIKQDGVKVGRFGQFNPSAATEFGWFHGSVVLTPAAGAHTYSLSLERSGGTGTLTSNASADGKAFILVRDLGPSS
jgi:hypothetical protein